MSEKTEQSRLLSMARDGKCSVARLLIKSADWPRGPLKSEIERLVLERATFEDVRFFLAYWPDSTGEAYWSRLLHLAADQPCADKVAQVVSAWFCRCNKLALGERWPELEALLLKHGLDGPLRIYLDDLEQLGGPRWKEGEVHLLCKAI